MDNQSIIALVIILMGEIILPILSIRNARKVYKRGDKSEFVTACIWVLVTLIGGWFLMGIILICAPFIAVFRVIFFVIESLSKNLKED